MCDFFLSIFSLMGLGKKTLIETRHKPPSLFLMSPLVGLSKKALSKNVDFKIKKWFFLENHLGFTWDMNTWGYFLFKIGADFGVFLGIFCGPVGWSVGWKINPLNKL